MQKRGMTITLTTIRGVLYLQRTHDVRVNTLAHPVKTVADEPNTHAKIHAHLLPHLLETPVQKKSPMNHTNLGIVGTTDFCQILGMSGQFPKPNFPAIQKRN